MSSYIIISIQNGKQSTISLMPGTNLEEAKQRAKQAKNDQPKADVLLVDLRPGELPGLFVAWSAINFRNFHYSGRLYVFLYTKRPTVYN